MEWNVDIGTHYITQCPCPLFQSKQNFVAWYLYIVLESITHMPWCFGRSIEIDLKSVEMSSFEHNQTQLAENWTSNTYKRDPLICQSNSKRLEEKDINYWKTCPYFQLSRRILYVFIGKLPTFKRTIFEEMAKFWVVKIGIDLSF